MKKVILIILCAALFLLSVGAGAAYLYFSPRGSLRPEGPEEVMQAKIESMTRDAWREEYVRLCPPQVTEFEDAATVAGHIFDAAVTTEPFTFREVPGSAAAEEQDYILSTGDTDLLLAHLTFADRQWGMEPRPLDTLHSDTRTLTITVPEGTQVTLNGKPVSEKYITDPNVIYPEMTELELRFASYPHQVRYTIEGIYEAAEIDAQRDDGLVLLYSDGTEWRYTMPDAGAYTFSVTAPENAVVNVGGADLTVSDITATTSVSTRLDIPDELQPLIPTYSIYTAGGLYTQPDISAVLPDGTQLTGTEQEGSIYFAMPGSTSLYDSYHEQVEAFLKTLCEYGAGHIGSYTITQYTVDGAFRTYLTRAVDSLHWTVGVTVEYADISSSDYMALGDNAFICHGHVTCTTTTRYQTADLDMDYEMLWVNRNGTWLIQDLAFL